MSMKLVVARVPQAGAGRRTTPTTAPTNPQNGRHWLGPPEPRGPEAKPAATPCPAPGQGRRGCGQDHPHATALVGPPCEAALDTGSGEVFVLGLGGQGPWAATSCRLGPSYTRLVTPAGHMAPSRSSAPTVDRNSPCSFRPLQVTLQSTKLLPPTSSPPAPPRLLTHLHPSLPSHGTPQSTQGLTQPLGEVPARDPAQVTGSLERP